MESAEGLYITRSSATFFLVQVTKAFSEGSYDVGVRPASRGPGRSSSSAGDDACCCMTLSLTTSFAKIRGEIDYVAFHEGCSLFEPMKRGVGTRDMVKSTLSLCRELFDVTTFDMMDNSMFTCGPEDRQVDLWAHNLLVYGKTWYERMFDAAPSPDGFSNSGFERSRELLSETVDPYRAERITGFISSDPDLDRTQKERLKATVDGSVGTRSWNETFFEINSGPDGCVFFAGRSMYRAVDLFGIPNVDSWYIPITDEDVEEYLLAHEKIVA